MRYLIYVRNGTLDLEKPYGRTCLLLRTDYTESHHLKCQKREMGFRGPESLDCKEQWDPKGTFKPLLSSSGCWTFGTGTIRWISKVWSVILLLNVSSMCLWLTSAHFIHQICFYYLQLHRASSSLQKRAGSDFASHIPDRTVNFISITKSW